MAKRAKILVVDDDRDYQAAIRQILQGADYEVVSAHTKQEGLEALAQEAPDLVILDIMMNRSTDGFHFLYEADAQEGGRPPVLSVSCIEEKTGMHFSPETNEGYFPAEDYLTKPVDPDELLQHVAALLEQGRPAASR